MTLRLGRIPYLNTEPFFGDDETRRGCIVASPREIAHLAQRGEVWLAPLPVVAAFEFPDLFRPVGPMGIACAGPVRSVLLKSSVPPEELGGLSIGVINDTATSVRLLQVLLRLRYGVDGPITYRALDAGGDAVLLIGDRAIREGAPSEDYPVVLDLAAAWKEWTGLPFIFALWYARPELDAETEGRMVEYFSESLDRNLACPEILWRRRQDLGLSLEQVRDYVAGFEFRIGEDAMRGLRRFKELDSMVHERGHAA